MNNYCAPCGSSQAGVTYPKLFPIMATTYTHHHHFLFKRSHLFQFVAIKVVKGCSISLAIFGWKREFLWWLCRPCNILQLQWFSFLLNCILMLAASTSLGPSISEQNLISYFTRNYNLYLYFICIFIPLYLYFCVHSLGPSMSGCNPSLIFHLKLQFVMQSWRVAATKSRLHVPKATICIPALIHLSYFCHL